MELPKPDKENVTFMVQIFPPSWKKFFTSDFWIRVIGASLLNAAFMHHFGYSISDTMMAAVGMGFLMGASPSV